MNFRLAAVALLAVLAVHVAAHSADAPVRKQFQSAGLDRVYYLYVPPSAASASIPPPVLMLLHGSGANGLSLVSLWKEEAAREGIVLVGPDALDTLYWRLPNDGPPFIRDLIENVSREFPIDKRRLYLFGQSGGAVYALTLSMLESRLFAATAIHAGAWREKKEFQVVPLATRKIPVAIFIGDRDEFFPVKSVRQTEAALRDAGHPVQVTLLKRHWHGFDEKAAALVNAPAWAFLHAIELEQDPVFQSYESSGR